MEEIIKKAIKGGWRNGDYTCRVSVMGICQIEPFSGDKDIPDITLPEMLMDDGFWKALQKSCKWRTGTNNHWIKKALRFHEIKLTEGWDSAVSYLTNLIKQSNGN